MDEFGQIEITDEKALEENRLKSPKPASEPILLNAESLQSAKKSKIKLSVITLCVALVLCAISGAIGFVLASGDHNNKVTANGDISANEDSNNSEELQDQPVTLSIDDELVQKVYRRFERVSFPDENMFSFYADKSSMAGKPDRTLMLYLAKNNVVTRFCKGEYFDSVGHTRMSTCYSGGEIVDEIAEIFGQNLVLNESDRLGHGCGSWVYDIQNNEFHQETSAGCGGMDPRRVARKLYAAERDSEHIYLYELAIYIEATAVYHISDGELAGTFMGQQSDLEIETDVRGDALQGDIDEYKNLLEQGTFKWTFTKNADGDYIYTSLERI